ncbi:MAG: helix-turn-helix domain-containing protein [Bacteroidota bacterium]
MPDFWYNGRVYYNPVEFAVSHLGGLWKMPILWRLQKGTLRYGQLKEDIAHISDKMLSSQLKELVKDGFVKREVYPEVPPKTEYSLTEKGKKSIPIIEVIRTYGLNLMDEAGIDTDPYRL